MRLVVISWADYFEGEAEVVNALFARGLERLHLRKPDSSEADVERLLRQIDQQYYERVTLHYFPELAMRMGVGGVHVSGRCQVVPHGWKGRVSASCHTLPEVERAKKGCDYLFLSPIYNSISKSGYGSAFSHEELRGAREAGVIDGKVLALGGVTVARLAEVRAMGFGGVAVLGGLWGDREHKSVIERWERLSEEVERVG